MIGRKLAFWNGWWGDNQSASSLGNFAGNSAGNLAGNAVGNLVGNAAGQGGGDKAYLKKAVIGGNLAFGIGWWGANQSTFSLGNATEKLSVTFSHAWLFLVEFT